VALQPGNTLAHNSLGNALWLAGKQDEAVAEYRTANRLDPANAYALVNLGNALWRSGKLDEAIVRYQSALRLDAQDPVTHNNLGAALWEQGRLDEAAAAYRNALRLNLRYPEALSNLGGVLRMRGEFREACDVLRKAQELLPPGDPRSKPWEGDVKNAERLRLLGEHLDAIIGGRQKPADTGETVDQAEVCLYRHYPAAAARLFRDAFAAAPRLGDRNRFEAAQTAAQAGLGKGTDAMALTEGQRAVWRTQARDWLRAELAAQAGPAAGDNPAARQAAARQLRLWQCHVDFAGLREEAELNTLPADEQVSWRSFWADVAALVERAEKR
jgi:tetratricopeptide (TPR) repeat protein